jgi:hypothetical protein
MPTFESGVAAALIAKFGWLKAFTLGSALAGAALMAVFRPPLNRKEMFLQATVALGCSFLFGDTLTNFLDNWFEFIDFQTSSWEKWMQFSITVHAFVGALSWGFFGGMAHLRDKFSKDPVQTVKDVKEVI